MRHDRTAVGLLAAALLLSACSSGGEDGPVVTVTVPPSAASSPDPGSGSPTGAATTPPTTSATPSPSATALPGTCDSLLADFTVTQALGNVQLAGTTAFVVGVPDTKIGRLSTINCRYGVTGAGAGAAAKTKVEIGVSLYATDAQAATRVSATESDYTSRGATGKDVQLAPVGGAPAVTARYLTGAVGTGYDLPLMVATSGRRTVAVTVDPAAVPTPPAEQAATALTQLAFTRTAG